MCWIGLGTSQVIFLGVLKTSTCSACACLERAVHHPLHLHCRPLAAARGRNTSLIQGGCNGSQACFPGRLYLCDRRADIPRPLAGRILNGLLSECTAAPSVTAQFTVIRPFNYGLLSSLHFELANGTMVALAPSELAGIAETARARLIP